MIERLPAAALLMGLGGFSALLAFVLSVSPLKYVGAILAGTLAIPVAAALRSFNRVIIVLLAAMAITTSLNLDVTFVLQEFAAHYYLWQTSGSSGVHLTVPVLAGGALCAIYAWQYAAEDRRPAFRFQSRMTTALILYFCAGLLSFINADVPFYVLLDLIRLLSLFVVFVAISNLGEQQTRFFLCALAVSVIIQGSIATAQTITNSMLGLEMFGEAAMIDNIIGGSPVPRAMGTIGHPNGVGNFMELTVPIMFALFLNARSWPERLLFLAATGIGLCGAVTTLSRATWGALAVALPLVFFLVYRDRLLQFRTAAYAVPAMLVVVIGGIFAYPTIEKRLTTYDGGSAATRLPTNLAALNIIEQFPVFGVGLNNYAGAYVKYDETGGSRTWGPANHLVHNMYLLVWGEIGTVGFIAFLWVFGATFTVALRVYGRGPPFHRALVIGTAGGLLAHCIHGLADPAFTIGLLISQIVYAMFGLIAGADLRVEALYGARGTAGEPAGRRPS